MFHRFPREDPSLKFQTQLTDLDDATYRAGYTCHDATTQDRLIQIAFFVLFLGWARLPLCILSTLVLFVVAIPLAAAPDAGLIRRFYLPFAVFFARRVWAPIFLACLGLFRVKFRGKVDPGARCFIFNHTSLFDGPLLFHGSRITMVTHTGIGALPVIGRALAAIGTVFIDRTRKDGNSQVIAQAMANPAVAPLTVAPEGKISNGDYLFRFRTGAFLTDHAFQPLTIRYTHFLPVAGITPNSLPDNDLDWFWRCLCCPWASVELTYLEPILAEELAGKTPQEKADMTQLRIANALGTLAGARSSRELFEKRKAR
jgi:1-acyl-sn-glycerol-3-phosphate acyltransferase